MVEFDIRKQWAKIFNGHVIANYPRKKLICIDGFKYFNYENSI